MAKITPCSGRCTPNARPIVSSGILKAFDCISPEALRPGDQYRANGKGAGPFLAFQRLDLLRAASASTMQPKPRKPGQDFRLPGPPCRQEVICGWALRQRWVSATGAPVGGPRRQIAGTSRGPDRRGTGFELERPWGVAFPQGFIKPQRNNTMVAFVRPQECGDGQTTVLGHPAVAPCARVAPALRRGQSRP
jgi:hypothetical protein